MAAAEKLITDNLDIWASAVQMKSAAGRGKSNNLELYGIKKLRELILGTALAGGFSPDVGDFDKPAEDLIKAARQSYAKSTGRKLKDYKQGDALLAEFDLPAVWPWVRVANICDLQTGATPSRQKTEYFGGDIRWLVSGDINQGEINDCEGRITEEGLAASNCKILPTNTVLIALNGQGKTRASVAHLNVEATCNQSVVAIIPFDRNVIDSRFLLLALRYRYYEIRDITGQKQRRGLNMGLVAQLSVPLPPIDVQKRIVAKVDELMALCDKLEQQQEASITAHQALVQTLLDALTTASERDGFTAAWARIADHFDTLFTTEWSIDQLKQTILQLAVTGKLVPQDPDDEPASELLKKIAAEKAQLVQDGKLKKQKKLPPIEEDEKLFELPKGWEWCKFGVAADFINGDRSKNYPNKSEYVDEGVPWINTGHIEPNGTLSTVSMNFITREKFDSLRGGKIKANDLVYCLRGATFGKTAFVTPFSEGAIASSLMIIRPYLSHLGGYIYRYLISPFGKRQLFRFDNGSAQPNLSANSVTLYAFPLPPLNEQNRIVAKTDELMALCEQLKTRLNTAQTTQFQLADAMAKGAVA